MIARRATLVGLACLAAAGCLSPTLPLPPPELPSIAPSVTPGRYVLTGRAGAAASGAILIAINLNPSVPRDQRVSGAQANDDGSYRLEVVGRSGDRFDLTQDVGSERSPSITFSLP